MRKYGSISSMFHLLIVLFTPQISQCIHREFDDIMLKHKLGAVHIDRVSPYSLSTPLKTNSNGGFFYEIEMDKRVERFWLEPKDDVISAEYHIVHREGNNSSVRIGLPRHCIYQGHSVSHNGSIIALSGCEKDMHGLVISAEGEHFLIQPKAPDASEHIIRKRSSQSDGHTCLFNRSDDPFPEERIRTRRHPVNEAAERLPVLRNEEMIIELAVFADDALWNHFLKMYTSKADAELHKFILAAVNNIDILYAQRSIQPKMRVKLVRYEVLKSPPPVLSGFWHKSGDVDRLLDAFCDFQHQINPKSDSDPRHWDHALLFSGYDLYRDGLYTVAGYAPVKGMCSGQRSCTINEGLDFGSVFVVTHEMGHSLGMYHDGDNECDLRCCIMSPSIGSGKTHWSQCSVKEMRNFLQRLGNGIRAPNCLRDAPMNEQRFLNLQDDPGQTFPLDEQCEIFHGQCWRHELKDGQVLEDVCRMVWCGNGEGIIRTAHPALEGTFCGPGKVCRSGSCVRTGRILSPVAGGWSQWDRNPPLACGGTCSTCHIQGQIRLRRSTRRCNSPSPNNGGPMCPGDDAKGVVCASQVCNGISTVDYATRQCTSIRDDKDLPNPQLSGEGVQFDQAPCKVWCLLTLSNNIRTVSNYPDGTPCGQGKYCIKGECRPLLCRGTMVAGVEENCPILAKQSKSTLYKEEKKASSPAPAGKWSAWSLWSSCFASACGLTGVRLRNRRCQLGTCFGPEREKLACIIPCTGNTTPTVQTTTSVSALVTQERTIWSIWSGCSVSCGVGKRQRRKKNCTTNCTEIEQCIRPQCPTQSMTTILPLTTTLFTPSVNEQWSPWGSWSVCSRTCGQGIQTRRRHCNIERCMGGDSQARVCLMPACSDVWSLWSNWSECSSPCGLGVRTRRRSCNMPPCKGIQAETIQCRGERCNAWRGPRQIDFSRGFPQVSSERATNRDRNRIRSSRRFNGNRRRRQGNPQNRQFSNFVHDVRTHP